jgi:hypothetical protein
MTLTVYRDLHVCRGKTSKKQVCYHTIMIIAPIDQTDSHLVKTRNTQVGEQRLDQRSLFIAINGGCQKPDAYYYLVVTRKYISWKTRIIRRLGMMRDVPIHQKLLTITLLPLGNIPIRRSFQRYRRSINQVGFIFLPYIWNQEVIVFMKLVCRVGS